MAISQVVLKNFLDKSDLVRRLYVQAAILNARGHSLRGDILGEVHHLMRAWRGAGQSPEGIPGFKEIRRAVLRHCFDGDQLLPIAGNGLLASFQSSREAREVRAEFAKYPLADRVRLRYPREDEDPERQGDLMILKRFDPESGEKGVLLVTYTEAIRRFAAMFDLPSIAERYMLVHEPSWWGYADLVFLLYVGSDLDVLVQSPWPKDAEFLRHLETNLAPVRVGAGDWIDPDTFQPGSGAREFDVVMVSSWSPVKGHEELFKTLARLREERNRELRTALVGYPGGWTREHIESLMRKHRVADLCSIFESVSHERVAEIVGNSRMYVLLSRREGANRALYEAFFCNTPVVVFKGHKGVNLDHISGSVGVGFEEGRLGDALVHVLDHPEEFAPREWALANTGWQNATRQLNDALRDLATSTGRPWIHDIAPKKMAPNLRYAEAGRYREFDEEYQALTGHLLPDS